MDTRRELMRELRWVVIRAAEGRPDMLGAFDETLRLAVLGAALETERPWESDPRYPLLKKCRDLSSLTPRSRRRHSRPM
jgi:hypothetical protein